jgi:outer membrane protein assembly factor BamB
MVQALGADRGDVLWQLPTNAAVVSPPAYWNGRVVAGSCDGILYCADAVDGQLLGQVQIAPQKRFVNIMDRFMSAWPLGGGVVLGPDAVAYTVAGSTAADGAIVAAIDLANGKVQWQQAYTPDRKDPTLTFGVQGNLLLMNNTLFVNGGAPTGIVAVDSGNGGNARIAAKLDAGRELFLEPDGTPTALGPELYSGKLARTTIFKRHVGRVYFPTPESTIALVDGRLFCTKNTKRLDAIVNLVNEATKKAGTPPDVMKVQVDDTILWAGKTADVCGVAVGTNGLVALHRDQVQGLALSGQSLWSVKLPAPPVRWGIAVAGNRCFVTLTNGTVVCLGAAGP